MDLLREKGVMKMSRNIDVWYGYGLCTARLEVYSVERIEKLLEMAPKRREEIHDFFDEEEISKPDVLDYIESNGDDGNFGFATFLKNILNEITGINFTDCEDFDGNGYLIYEPRYPWDLSEREKDISKEKIKEIYIKYISLITDMELDIDELIIMDGD